MGTLYNYCLPLWFRIGWKLSWQTCTWKSVSESLEEDTHSPSNPPHTNNNAQFGTWRLTRSLRYRGVDAVMYKKEYLEVDPELDQQPMQGLSNNLPTNTPNTHPSTHQPNHPPITHLPILTHSYSASFTPQILMLDINLGSDIQHRTEILLTTNPWYYIFMDKSSWLKASLTSKATIPHK